MGYGKVLLGFNDFVKTIVEGVRLRVLNSKLGDALLGPTGFCIRSCRAQAYNVGPYHK